MARPRLISDEQILAAMRACVIERGPAVSLEKVADELNVTAPALLKRFGSRQELLLKALKLPSPDRLLAAFDAPTDERPLEAQLASLFEETWAFFAEAIPCVTALRESGLGNDQILRAAKTGPLNTIKALTRWLERAQQKGLIESAAHESVATAMLGALQTRVFTSHVLKVTVSARSQREYIHDIAELFARALSPTKRGRHDKAG